MKTTLNFPRRRLRYIYNAPLAQIAGGGCSRLDPGVIKALLCMKD